MNLSIIENCSPYYIRFTHNNVDEVISKCLEFVDNKQFINPFTHYVYPLDNAKSILSLIPITTLIDFDPNRVSLFVTQPGVYYRAHKDGNIPPHRFSINYTVKILDNSCVTSWYSDEDLKGYFRDYRVKNSRECLKFDKNKHTPLHSMTAIQGECILFNTEIYHDFDNSESLNERMILTLRHVDPASVYFEDIRKVLFNI